MRVKLYTLENSEINEHLSTAQTVLSTAQLIFVFGENNVLGNENTFELIHQKFPTSQIVFCSSLGQVADTEIYESKVIITAIEFAKTEIKCESISINEFSNCIEAGREIGKRIQGENLKHILLFCDGVLINGSDILNGLYQTISTEIPVTGGLSGDGALFEDASVGLNKVPTKGTLVAVGFYGHDIKINHGSLGGWDSFGLTKTVTKSEDNILFEIDHKPALDLYKEYLGKYVDDLPTSALFFPLALITEGSSDIITRTILSIDEKKQCLVFAGDIPQGSKVKFMKSNMSKLIIAAGEAAKICKAKHHEQAIEFALAVSCVGRKLVLKHRTEEEVESVKEQLGIHTVLSGFYSHGELVPFNNQKTSHLQNQTMTITTFSEA